MLTHFLNNTLMELKNIIKLTNDDIYDIKHAQHEAQFERSATKVECITKFEHNKSILDNEITKLASANPEKKLTELLSEDDFLKLDELKLKLFELKKINKKYAKMVLSVSEFYNSLLEKVIPYEQQGYERVVSYESNRLEIRV